jgi:hypothetical protein
VRLAFGKYQVAHRVRREITSLPVTIVNDPQCVVIRYASGKILRRFLRIRNGEVRMEEGVVNASDDLLARRAALSPIRGNYSIIYKEYDTRYVRSLNVKRENGVKSRGGTASAYHQVAARTFIGRILSSVKFLKTLYNGNITSY